MKKWLHVIRREEGKYFKATEHTKVCTLHFTKSDNVKKLSGKSALRDGAVPSVFPWIRQSPTLFGVSKSTVSRIVIQK